MSGLTFRQHVPPPQLAHLVQCFWSLDGVVSPSDQPDPVPSDGSVEIVLNGGTRVAERRDDRSIMQPAAAVIGPTILPTILSVAGEIRISGVRLWPWAARAVLGVPAKELRDQTLALGDLGKRELDLLQSIDWSARSESRVPVIAAWLAGLRERRPHAAVLAIGERIFQSEKSVRALVNQTGMSWRHLDRLFSVEVGLRPKELLRLARFQRVMRLLRSTPTMSWSAIAHRVGFYDQPHLIREFRTLAGCTPRELRLDDGIGGTVSGHDVPTGRERI